MTTTAEQLMGLVRLGGVAVIAFGCMRGPGFMRQSDQGTGTETGTVVVEAKEEGGATTGAVSASAGLTQVLVAGDNSLVAGSSVAVPSGSLAIDTTLTLAEGADVSSVVASLELGTTVTAAAQAVTVSSSAPQDPVSPLLLAIPLPDAAGAGLTQDVGGLHLGVVYRVKREADGQTLEGAIPSELIEIAAGYARFAAKYFGTYQAIYTAAPLTTAVEAIAEVPEDESTATDTASDTDTSVATDTTPAPGVYFVAGPIVAAFGEGETTSGGLFGTVLGLTPARVGSATTLTSGYVHARPSRE